MDIQDLRKALNEGIVLFQFVKKDGTLRHARGTTCPDLVPTPKAYVHPNSKPPTTGRLSLSMTSTKRLGDVCVSIPFGNINELSN